MSRAPTLRPLRGWLRRVLAAALAVGTLGAGVPSALAGEPAGAAARPAPRRAAASVVKPVAKRTAPSAPTRRPHDRTHDGAHARVAVNHAGALRPARDVIGRREEPLSPEEDTARQIEQLLRGPLRLGVTGLYVADARTGEALFAVNADDRLNPASNVKLISTAAALELLGPEFRYPTRLLGAAPTAGVVPGDVYLLGSYDPTLTAGDLDELAAAVAAGGVTRIAGRIVVGADPTRDGVFRASVPIEIRAGEPGALAIATPPPALDFVSVRVTARTARAARRPRLTYQVDSTVDAAGHPRVTVTIGGTIGKGGAATYPLAVRERTALAAHLLGAALRRHGVAIEGEHRVAELGDFVGDAAARGDLAIELGRHDSPRLADIIARINKWSINWLADRVIMTAAALARRQPPSMELALSAMYDWLVRHPRIAKSDLVVDTGSGLSYRTQITARELVTILRSAGGFPSAGEDAAARAWLDSLAVAGTDGTLARRFRAADVRGHLRGKTGTLSTAIALSGILDVDPARPLAFSIVTNGDTPLAARHVRAAHEQLVGVLSRYLARTHAPGSGAAPSTAVAPPAPSVPAAAAAAAHELDELEPDPALDDETAAAP